MTAQCPASLTLDFDSIGCTRDEGHEGPHQDHGEDGEFVWITIETYSAALAELGIDPETHVSEAGD